MLGRKTKEQYHWDSKLKQMCSVVVCQVYKKLRNIQDLGKAWEVRVSQRQEMYWNTDPCCRRNEASLNIRIWNQLLYSPKLPLAFSSCESSSSKILACWYKEGKREHISDKSSNFVDRFQGILNSKCL